MIAVKIPESHLYDEFNPDEIVFLISWFDESNPERKGYRISKQVPTTNSIGEKRVQGWLGCTNNINMTACGAYRIHSMRMLTKKIEGFKQNVGVSFKLIEVDCEE